ncbi:MAG: hypothetical protein ACTIK3_04340, partial [Sphingobacteriaceae bacterium]
RGIGRLSVSALSSTTGCKKEYEQFSEHVMFQLTEEEVEIMVSRNVIPSRQHLGGALHTHLQRTGC